MSMRKQITVDANINWNAILYGTIFAVAVALVLLVTSGIIMYLTRAAELWMPFVSTAIFGISALAGGIACARKSGEKGLIHGLIIGIIFIVVISILSLFLPGEVSWLVFLKKVVVGIIAGVLGGVFGVK